MSPRSRRAGLTCAALMCSAALHASEACAAEDGVYGRFEGDLLVRAGAGMALAKAEPSLAIGASALYLSSAGVYAHYTDALVGDASRLGRTLTAGVVLAPLFLARYASNFEQGPARFDLLIDSFTLEIGSFWSAPRDSTLRPRPGLELGLGLSVPIFPRASGLFIDLRGGLRIDRNYLSTKDGPIGSADRSGFLSFTLSWHQMIATHLVDLRDRAPR